MYMLRDSNFESLSLVAGWLKLYELRHMVLGRVGNEYLKRGALHRVPGRHMSLVCLLNMHECWICMLLRSDSTKDIILQLLPTYVCMWVVFKSEKYILILWKQLKYVEFRVWWMWLLSCGVFFLKSIFLYLKFTWNVNE